MEKIGFSEKKRLIDVVDAQSGVINEYSIAKT
jgi:hypothetical protein